MRIILHAIGNNLLILISATHCFTSTGVHWLLMTVWVIFHDTDFCPTVWEERMYNAVVGVIYTFCFFNVKEGRSRRRVVSFYALTGLQNVVFLLVYCLASEHDDLHMLVATAVVVGTFVTGKYQSWLSMFGCQPYRFSKSYGASEYWFNLMKCSTVCP